MTKEELSEKLRAVIIDQFGILPETVTPEARFIEDLGCDSLDVVEMAMAVEEEFDVCIPDEDAENIVTVGDAERLLCSGAYLRIS